MNDVYEPIQVGPGVLRRYLQKGREEGWRLVQVHACSLPEGYQLVYSIAREYEIVHYEMHILSDTAVESISDIFPSAALYEQEMAELFGVNIVNVSNDPPFTLYHLSDDAPMK